MSLRGTQLLTKHQLPIRKDLGSLFLHTEESFWVMAS